MHFDGQLFIYIERCTFPIRKYFYFFKLTFTIKFQNNVFTQKYGKVLVFHLFEF